jgi:hypothetical protein
VVPAGARQRMGSAAPLPPPAPAAVAAPAAAAPAALVAPPTGAVLRGASAPGSAPQPRVQVANSSAAAQVGALGKTNILRVSPGIGATSALVDTCGTRNGLGAKAVLSRVCGEVSEDASTHCAG